jgi:aldose 1-epimerase
MTTTASTQPAEQLPGGAEWQLRSGPYAAVITSVGATLRSLTYDGRDLVVPFSATSIRPSYRGAVIAPWPNRIAGGRYAYAGKTHQLPINDIATGAALHGLVHWVRWDLNQVTDSRIVLSHSIVPQSGYPFIVKLRIAYELRGQGLSARLVADNPTAEPVPYGCCPHPYLSAGPAGLDDWELLLSARSRIDVDQRLTPIGAQDVQAVDCDFRTAAAIGSRQIDHAFTGLSPDHDHRFTVSLRDRTNRTGVRMSWGSWGQWVQLHTADGPEAGNRVGLAVEPMSCPPNAFNGLSGPPLLHPRQFFEADWNISDLPPRT